MILFVKDVVVDDTGNISCYAENIVGRVFQDIRLIVDGTLEIFSSRDPLMLLHCVIQLLQRLSHLKIASLSIGASTTRSKAIRHPIVHGSSTTSCFYTTRISPTNTTVRSKVNQLSLVSIDAIDTFSCYAGCLTIKTTSLNREGIYTLVVSNANGYSNRSLDVRFHHETPPFMPGSVDQVPRLPPNFLPPAQAGITNPIKDIKEKSTQTTDNDYSPVTIIIIKFNSFVILLF